MKKYMGKFILFGITFFVCVSCGQFGSLSGNMEDLWDDVRSVRNYSVNFDGNGGVTGAEPQSVQYGGKATKPSDAEREEWFFDGWYREAACATKWNFDIDQVTENITLYAGWAELPDGIFTVKFNSYGGSSVPLLYWNKGMPINPQPQNPNKPGEYFLGWYKDAGLSEPWDFLLDKVNGNLSLYAKWEFLNQGQYKVQFIVNGAVTVPVDQAINSGSLLNVYPTVTKPDPLNPGQPRVFGGWYTNPECTNFWALEYDTVTASNTTGGVLKLYAKWTAFGYRTVNFCYNALGSIHKWVYQIDVPVSSFLPEPEIPHRRSYELKGWYGNPTVTGDEYKPGVAVVITANYLNYYAKWSEKITIPPGNTLDEKFNWLRDNAISDTTYYVTTIDDLIDGIPNDATNTTHSRYLSFTENGIVQQNITINLSGNDSTIWLNTLGSFFSIGEGVNLILSGNLILKGCWNNNSALINVYKNGHFEISTGVKITGNYLFDNENLYIEDEAALTGGVYINLGSFIMNGGEISNNTGLIGGGVSIIGGRENGEQITGTFIMNNGYITGNSSLIGGGVNIGNRGSFIMKGGEIFNNIANEGGGGVVVNGSSSAYTYFIMENGKITGNTSLSGGGVLVESYGEFIFKDGEISSNNTFIDPEYQPNDDDYDDNTGYAGGGVYIYSRGKFKMESGKINENTASKYGGGLCIFHSAYVEINGGDIINNVASQGGGVYLVGDSRSSPEIYLNGGKINNNIAFHRGGGVYTYNRGNIIIMTGEISHNSAPDGGGVYIGYRGFLEMFGGEITINFSLYGGGVSIGNHGLLEMFDGEIYNNSVTVGGGGVNVNEYGAFGMYGGKINNNSAFEGGGVFVEENGEFVMNGGEITFNKTSGSGGGVCAAPNSFFTMTKGIISGNITDGSGGGVHIAGDFSMDDEAIISGNTANHSGGGVYAGLGRFLMNGGKIFSNNVPNNNDHPDRDHPDRGGGGVFIWYGTFIMNGGIIGNTYPDDGINIGNSAYNGGGVKLYQSNLIMSGESIISGNIATNSGGGVYAYNDGSGIFAGSNGIFTMSNNAIISGNTALVYGGGVYTFPATSVFIMEGGKIQNNSAYNGGGVYSNNFTMHGGIIGGPNVNDSNKASNYGGGIFGSGITINDTAFIIGNYALKFGGGIFGGNLIINGGVIIGNMADEKGGGVYISALNGASFIKSGGGIISGFIVGDSNSNVVGTFNDPVNNKGHAVCVSTWDWASPIKYKDTTVGPTDYLFYDQTQIPVFGGDWDY